MSTQIIGITFVIFCYLTRKIKGSTTSVDPPAYSLLNSVPKMPDLKRKGYQRTPGYLRRAVKLKSHHDGSEEIIK